jgi:Gpi18-like mannosyltransferase
VLALILEIFKNYRPLAFFGGLAAFFALSGMAAGIPVLQDYYRDQYIRHVPFAILSTGLMIIAFLSMSIGLILDTVTAHNHFLYGLRLLDSATPRDRSERARPVSTSAGQS